MKNQMLVLVLLSLSASSLLSQKPPDSKPPKLAAEDIVRKHLSSIGKDEDLSALKSIVMVGQGTITSKLGASYRLGGNAQIASTGRSFLLAMVFDSPTYPYEKFAFDGNEVSYGLLNGRPTILGNFLKSQSSIVKEGLIGGVFSTAWPLHSLQRNSKVKIDYDGISKLGERQCYKLKYNSPKMGDVRVSIYFDAETFRHLRSEYQYTIEPRIGSSPTDVRSGSSIERYVLTENFGEFKAAGKLVLPTVYRINITTERQIATDAVSRDWTLTIDQVYFNETIGPEQFRVS